MLSRKTAILDNLDLSSYYPLTNITINGIPNQNVLPNISLDTLAASVLVINGISYKPNTYKYNSVTYLFNSLNDGFSLDFDQNVNYVYIKFNNSFELSNDSIIFKYF